MTTASSSSSELGADNQVRELTPDVMMVVAMSRLLRDEEIAFHGVASPLPMVAILLARATHAPNLVYLNITGSVDARPGRLPHSTVDPALLTGTRSLMTLADIFDLSARGELDTVFLSGVQIDGQGRINMSAIGDYSHPRVRLPGGAGSAFLMSTANRILLWRTRHDRRTFVEELAFVTGTGRVDRVVTPLCVFKRNRQTGHLEVESIHPYATADEVEERTGFTIPAQGAPVTPAPTGEELTALAQVDPEGVRRIEFG
jgi:glutaconate CoA-transferase subunit B